MSPRIRIIVGLGNPGAQHVDTRHNAGSWYVKALAEQESVSFVPERKFFAKVARIERYSEPVWIVEPAVYMNESGKTVAAIANFYKIPSTSILIAHDELDFPVGEIRLKQDGGHGGHNGLRNIIEALGTNNFVRLRIGIDHPGHKELVSPYVLGNPSRSDRLKINEAISNCLAATDKIIGGDLQIAFQAINGG